MLDTQLLFFFSAIGVFNALLLCIYLFLGITQKKIEHYLLATLLLMFCIRVGVSCIYFFEKNLSPHWIQLGLSAGTEYSPNTSSSRAILSVIQAGGYKRKPSLIVAFKYSF